MHKHEHMTESVDCQQNDAGTHAQHLSASQLLCAYQHMCMCTELHMTVWGMCSTASTAQLQ